MYTTIAIFYISIAGMAALILLKRRELKTGVPSLVSKMGAGSDHFFQTVFSAVRRDLSYLNRRTAAAIASWAAYHVLLRIRNIYISIKSRFIANPQGKKLLDAVRGRGEVSDHGVSFYLRRIAADPPKK
ncbi:MAG: hypothetical protein ABSF56_03630 [Minisyncoccia bacterium]|jgi:preprotein translocase subunit SecG